MFLILLKKEIQLIFRGKLTFLFLGFVTLLYFLTFSANYGGFFQKRVMDFSLFYKNQIFCLIFVVNYLGALSWFNEYKNKTLSFLRLLKASFFEQHLVKILSVCLISFSMVLLSHVFIIVSSFLGSVSFGLSFSSLGGLLLYILFLSSLSSLISYKVKGLYTSFVLSLILSIMITYLGLPSVNRFFFGGFVDFPFFIWNLLENFFLGV